MKCEFGGFYLLLLTKAHVPQVTRGKTGLDKALKLAKKLKKEMALIREMLHTMEELDTKEGTEAPRNLDKELQWVKVSTCGRSVFRAQDW